MERESAPQLSDMQSVMVAGNKRHQFRENGQFVSADLADAAEARAEAVLHETVHELGDVSQSEYAGYRDELGLSPVHEHWKGGSAAFDRQSALDAAAEHVNGPDSEAVQERELAESHDERQAFYNNFFGGMSDEEIARKADGISYKKKVAEHTEKHDAEVAQRHEEAMHDQELKNARNLKSMSITELAGLLGEKPSFQTSKSEYISRIEARQKELSQPESSGVLEVREPKPDESTKATVQAMKDFHKGKLSGNTSDSNVDDEEAQNRVPQIPIVDEHLDLDKRTDNDDLSGEIPLADQIRWVDDEVWGDDEESGAAALAVATGSKNQWGMPEGPGSLAGTVKDIETDPENNPGKEKMSRRKKIAAALVALAATVGIGVAIKSLDNDSKSNEAPVINEVETESDGTTPLDLSEAESAFDESTDDETDAESPLNLDDAMSAFDEETTEESSETEEMSDSDMDETTDETSEEAKPEESSQSLTVEDLVIAEDAEPMQAGEGNTAWDRAEAQGLDMNKFGEATKQTIALYNEYAEAHNMDQLEYRDGNIWIVGTNNQINPAQYAIYAQIQQDVVAWMTGANPNSPAAAELPELK